MKIGQCIGLCDQEIGNRFSEIQKAAWIAVCEAEVRRELVRIGLCRGECATRTAPPCLHASALAVPPPHDRLYFHYLTAMIAAAGGNPSLYDASMRAYAVTFAAYLYSLSEGGDRMKQQGYIGAVGNCGAQSVKAPLLTVKHGKGSVKRGTDLREGK